MAGQGVLREPEVVEELEVVAGNVREGRPGIALESGVGDAPRGVAGEGQRVARRSVANAIARTRRRKRGMPRTATERGKRIIFTLKHIFVRGFNDKTLEAE